MTPLRRLRRAAIDLRPLRHTDFRRLWVGNSLGFVGFQLTAVAVPVQVYELTGSSFWVGMLGLAGLVPLVLFGLWGGALADAVDRRVLLLGSSLLLWVCTGGLLVAAVAGWVSLPLLLGLVAVQAAGFAVASSTRGAIVPRVLPEPLVPAANTLSFTASNVGLVLGPLLAGLILARWSFAAAYAADLVVFTIALYAAARLPSLPPTGPATSPGLRSVADGLAFIATRPVLLLSFAVDIAAMVLAMPRALFPETAATLGATVSWVGGGLVCAALVGLALLVPALRDYDARAPQVENRVP
jgi:MFS family permease